MRVSGFGFRVPGFGFRVSGFGFRVLGFLFERFRIVGFHPRAVLDHAREEGSAELTPSLKAGDLSNERGRDTRRVGPRMQSERFTERPESSGF